ncbi:MAG: FlgO family outer membrane protein [Arcobacteraceae bacterium]|nr:FlgO family outer membrane protein [Arcobacteraceae bacterium]
MKTLLIRSLVLSCGLLLLGGCAKNIEPQIIEKEKIVYKVKAFDQIDELVLDISNQLQQSNKLANILPNEIAITAFVDLNQLNKTTRFGRVLSESFYNELFLRGFTVLDFRGQNAISVNATGEFFITRDVKKLSTEVKNSYVLVGTYAIFGKGIVVNARIIDNSDGKVVASARSIYNITPNCDLFETCVTTLSTPQATVSKGVKPKMIKLTTDNCSTKECPK